MGVIRGLSTIMPYGYLIVISIECGGKMHLREGEFSKAHTDFFEAFKNYDESGSRRYKYCSYYFTGSVHMSFIVGDLHA